MLASYNWIKEFGGFKMDPYEMADRLTAIGIEVEEVVEQGNDVTGCVVGQLLDIWKHPNADSLNMTRVRTNKGEFEIVCGADNLVKDAYVVVSLVGATLPGGVSIKRTKIRGVESDGMLCSRRELGLPQPEDDDGIYILPPETTLDTPVSDFLPETDYIFNIELTSNRNDCSSIYGLAREVAVICNTPFKQRIEAVHFKEQDGSVGITIEDEEFCPIYTARIIRNIKVEPSPIWLVNRLETHGIRSVNHVVDIINYSMLLYGQPMHVFDLDKLSEQKIEVRRAKKGEKLVVIGGKEIELDEGDQVISDGQKAIALAGVIGGEETAVSDETQNLLIESAYFNPGSIREISKRHKLMTDSAFRFQRGINIDMVSLSSNYATEYLSKYKGVVVGSSLKNIYRNKVKEHEILLEYDTIDELLGEKLDRGVVTKNLHMLGFKLQQAGEKQVKVTVPIHRIHDVKREVDIIEEIARCHGYDNFKPQKFMGTNKNMHIGSVKDEDYVQLLVALGYQQIMTTTFVENRFYEQKKLTDNMVQVLDPINVEQSYIRSDLFFGAMTTIVKNENKNNRHSGRIFEMGNVFAKQGDNTYTETKKIIMVCYGREDKHWYGQQRLRDFYDIKGDIEELLEACGVSFLEHSPITGHVWFHDKVASQIVAQGKVIGEMGIIRPQILSDFGVKERNVFAVELDVKSMPIPFRKKVKLKPVSSFPSIHRDLGFVVDKDFDLRPVMRKIKTHSKEILSVRLVDVYEGDKIPEGKRSVVLSLEYNSVEKTLKKEEVDETEKSLIESLAKEFDIHLR